MMGVSNGLFDDTPELSLRSLNFNWNSSKQVIEIFRLMGINCTDRDGKESVSSKTLVQLRRTSELVKLYLKYKELNTKIKAFGDKMLKLVKADGRIHCEYRQIGAETGRVSCKNPIKLGQ